MKTYKKIIEVKISMVNQSKMVENYTKTIKKVCKVGKVGKKKGIVKI